MNSNIYCNNCGKKGHGYYNCNLPITSNGIIAYRNNPNNNRNTKPPGDANS